MSENPYAAPSENPVAHPMGDGLGSSPYGPYRDLSLVSKLVVAVLVIGALISAARIVVLKFYIEANARFLNDLKAADEIDHWSHLDSQLLNADWGFFLVSIILWCVWKNLSCKNAWLFRSSKPSSRLERLISLQNLQSANEIFTPGWAVGWYFIPLANLWKPYQAMSFIRDEVAEQFQGGNLVGLWWLSYLVMNIGGTILTGVVKNSDTLESINDFNRNLMISHGLTIAATIFAILVVISLTKAQREKARSLGIISDAA